MEAARTPGSASHTVFPPCRWASCNETVNHDFDADVLNNYDQLLPPMMADGIRVMIYVGMEVGACWCLGSAH